ncbi:MAG: cytochrome-c oxidase [Acidobacteria bacterium]|nr:cytochrome-c oxidase [Acidobacteriota bacterium]
MIGIWMLRISAVYMVIGLVLGLAMGISGDFLLSSVHAHLSLLGWTTMSITGFVYVLFPACCRSRLAALHCWGHNIGLPVMMASLTLYTLGHKSAEKAIGAGSTIVLLSLLVFTANLFLNGRTDPPQ